MHGRDFLDVREAAEGLLLVVVEEMHHQLFALAVAADLHVQRFPGGDEAPVRRSDETEEVHERAPCEVVAFVAIRRERIDGSVDDPARTEEVGGGHAPSVVRRRRTSC